MKKNITEAELKTDYNRLSGMKDSEISYSDIPEPMQMRMFTNRQDA
jgi:hypothetical protein